ncbi:MAG: hypothetical protein NTX59_02580 [Elusimicrobia bacterium]|nr:hypothetical protein [Elusimicrobiota bacterium]
MKEIAKYINDKKFEAKQPVDFNVTENDLAGKLRAVVVSGYGVYIIYDCAKVSGSPLYIGKAGSFTNEGFGKQDLFLRLTRGRQEKKSRKEYFKKKMNDTKRKAIRICCYVTWKDGVGMLPAKAEADLIQLYYDHSHGKLPEWNKSF